MNTNKIQPNLTFSGFYRLPNTPENQEILTNLILPKVKAKELPMQICSGSTPISSAVLSILKNFSDRNNASMLWLKNHAKRFNVDIPIDNDVFIIATGEKDSIKLQKFEMKIVAKSVINTIKAEIKSIFGIKSKEYRPEEPYYIEQLRFFTQMYNSSKAQCDRFLEENKAVDVKDIQELLICAIREFV